MSVPGLAILFILIVLVAASDSITGFWLKHRCRIFGHNLKFVGKHSHGMRLNPDKMSVSSTSAPIYVCTRKHCMHSEIGDYKPE